MPRETAREVLGVAHYDYAVDRGPGYCASRAAGSWDANDKDAFGAYKAAQREAESAIHTT